MTGLNSFQNSRKYRFHSLCSLLLLAVTVVCPFPGITLAAQDKPPVAPPFQARPFPAFVDQTLPNGLRVLIVEDHRQPLVSLQLSLSGGAIYDADQKAGVASMTADLLTKGTTTRKAKELAQTVDDLGGALGAGAGDEYARVSASFLSNSTALALELLADVTLNPTFDEEELNRAKTQAISGFQFTAISGAYLAGGVFDRLLFGNTPYGRPSNGTPETVPTISRADIVAFHQKHYTPQGAILVVTGDVQPKTVMALITKQFGGWKGEAVPPLVIQPPADPKGLRIVVVDKPDAVQTEIRVGRQAFSITDPDRITASLMNVTLGGGLFTTRLMQEVRVKRGLTYGARSSLQLLTKGGKFTLSTNTKTESTVEVVRILLDELKKLRDVPISNEELAQRKSFMIGQSVLNAETPADVAGNLLDAIRQGGGKQDLDTYAQKVSAITAEAIQKVMRDRLNPDSSTIVLVGNAAGFEKELASLGKFEKIPFRDVDLMAANLRKPSPLERPASEAEKTAGAALFKQAVAALGGEAYVNQKTVIRQGSGKFAPPGLPQPLAVPSITNTTGEGGKSVLTIKHPAFEVSFGTVGDGKIWVVSPQGVQEFPNPEQGKFGIDILRKAAAHPETFLIRSLPDEEKEGQKYKVFAISDQDKHTTLFYCDPETGLLSRLAYKGQQGDTEELYADYADFSGVKVARKVTYKTNGAMFLDATFSEVKVNEPVPDSVFAKPAGK